MSWNVCNFKIFLVEKNCSYEYTVFFLASTMEESMRYYDKQNNDAEEYNNVYFLGKVIKGIVVINAYIWGYNHI